MENNDNFKASIENAVEIKVLQKEMDASKKKQDEIVDEFDSKLEGYKEYLNNKIERVSNDLKSLSAENNKIKEMVMDIKSSIKEGTMQTQFQIEGLKTELNQMLNHKKDTRNSFIYPLVYTIAGGIVLFVFDRFIK